MATELEYALFSAHVYGNKSEKTAPRDPVRNTQNTLPVPDGWNILDSQFLSDGFMASAYQNGNEIVISYAGTTEENSLDWPNGNLPAATATRLAPQVLDAAQFYLDITQANPNATISFTGHSLGGGLASLMAVYFNHPAQVFDEAPFIKSADSPLVVGVLKTQLTKAGYTLPQALTDYATSNILGVPLSSPTRLERQGHIKHTYVVGEVLSLVDTPVTDALAAALGVMLPSFFYPLQISGNGVGKINNGNETPIDLKAQSILGWGWPDLLFKGNPIDLHSVFSHSGMSLKPGRLR